MSSKKTDRARGKTGAAQRDLDQAFIAAGEAAQRADQAAFARFVARLVDRRAESLKKAGEPVS